MRQGGLTAHHHQQQQHSRAVQLCLKQQGKLCVSVWPDQSIGEKIRMKIETRLIQNQSVCD